MSTFRRVSMCQSFSHFPGFLHHFVLAKLATSSIRVKMCWSYFSMLGYFKNMLWCFDNMLGYFNNMLWYLYNMLWCFYLCICMSPSPSHFSSSLNLEFVFCHFFCHIVAKLWLTNCMKNWKPEKLTINPAWPQVKSYCLTCPCNQDSNPDSVERHWEVSGKTLDHSAIGARPVSSLNSRNTLWQLND